MPSVSRLCTRKTQEGVNEGLGSWQAAGLGLHTPLARIHMLLNNQQRPQLAKARTRQSAVADVATCEGSLAHLQQLTGRLRLGQLVEPDPPNPLQGGGKGHLQAVTTKLFLSALRRHSV